MSAYGKPKNKEKVIFESVCGRLRECLLTKMYKYRVCMGLKEGGRE